MQLVVVPIEKPEDLNVILGQAHFIKTVEDLHEALVGTSPHLRFGLAFCEASGKCLVRWSGTDAQLVELAQRNASAIAAGHSFILFLGEGFYPVNVLKTEQGRGILGVVDGSSPKGMEDEGEIQWRKGFLRQIGYKL